MTKRESMAEVFILSNCFSNRWFGGLALSGHQLQLHGLEFCVFEHVLKLACHRESACLGKNHCYGTLLLQVHDDGAGISERRELLVVHALDHHEISERKRPEAVVYEK